MATQAEIRREKLRNRSKQAVDNREKKGLGRKSVLDWGRFKGKKPDEFTPKTGKDKNVIDILPFIITQEWYKKLRTFSGTETNMDVGDWDYKLELPVHKNVGENNDTLLCLRLAFGGKCIRCDEMGEEYEKDEPKEKIINNLKPSWRVWYNLYDYDEEENPKGENQVWEDVSYHLFEKQVLEEEDEGEETICHSDIEMGKSIEFKGKEKKLGRNPFTEAQSVEFKDRDPYKEDIVKETVSFDALVKIPTVEEFTRIHLAEDSDKSNTSSSDDDKSTKSTRRKPKQSSTEKKEEKDDWKEEDGCPSGLEFGNPDPDSDECKNCKENIFDACATLQDQRRATEKEKEPEQQTTGRRKRRVKK